MTQDDNATDFYIMQLARSIDPSSTQKWVSEIAKVIREMGGSTVVPTKIGRSEPSLRRSGAIVIDEPLDEDMRSGATKRIHQFAEDYDVQAYIVHDLDVLELALNARAKKPAPLFFLAQDVTLNLGYFARRKLLKLASEVDHFICASVYVRNFYRDEFGVPEHDLSIIYEGFDLKSISSHQVSQERTMSLAHAWGAVENVAQLVLVPSVYNDPVWCDNLLAYAGELAKNGHNDIRYMVIGDDDGSGTMARLESSIYRTAPAHIQLVGHCADIEAAIKLTSTVLCFYSRLESQFSDALTAQALGRFVFLPGDCPASEEFIHTNITGSLLPSDPAEIREIVEGFVLNEHNLRDGNFVSSRSFIMKYFSREEMHKKLRALFEDTRFLDAH